jgi:hypothetical protein
MAQLVKGLANNLDGPKYSSQDSHGWKERTNYCKLSSDQHSVLWAYTPYHTHTHTHPTHTTHTYHTHTPHTTHTTPTHTHTHTPHTHHTHTTHTHTPHTHTPHTHTTHTHHTHTHTHTHTHHTPHTHTTHTHTHHTHHTHTHTRTHAFLLCKSGFHCKPVCPGAHRELLACASQALGLKAGASMPRLVLLIARVPGMPY